MNAVKIIICLKYFVNFLRFPVKERQDNFNSSQVKKNKNNKYFLLCTYVDISIFVERI